MNAPLQAPIGGSTRLFVIIGHPIAQVKSPQTFNPRLAAAGLDAVLVPMDIAPERFDETVRGLKGVANLDGIIITVPYKARILPLIDELRPMARTVGAANAMRREADGRWIGDIFDGTGLMRGLRVENEEPRGRRVMLLGAGGAGSAVAVAFAEAGAAAVTIHDVDGAKAEMLAVRVKRAFPDCDVRAGAPDLDAHDILVNATPTGMAEGDPLPVAIERLRSDMLVVDIIMKPEVTRFLAAARERGCKALPGKTMLEGQAAEVMKFFRVEGGA
ncbi:shikimate dehydrogenase family protein [Chelatococcus sp. GCM10030263]|uniref:shikimate dehydrogenase family protein n=1 Tax=Chelatococcus sp. GCM10030263 TaxID=3273387 RepID=UPI00361D68CA